MNTTPAFEDHPPLDDPLKTRLDESDAGSGTPLHRARARAEPVPTPVVSDHELLRIIGRGAYGEVWLARNIMGAYRAVKIVYRDSFDSDRPYEREFTGIQRFEPISRGHDSQLDILHVGRNEAARSFYYVMELADDASAEETTDRVSSTFPLPMGAAPGDEAPSAKSVLDPDRYVPRTVHSELKRHGRFNFAESLEISLALTTAVEHLHRHGLIHRDIKPSNVIFVNGRPKLADIGLITETGGTMSFVGTEGYLPPEGPGSVQADIYSLGKTLYEVATGKDRFEFPELPTMTGSVEDESGLFELNEVLLKACHPETQQRYRTAAEMHADLVLLQAGKSVRRSRAVERRLAMLTRVSVAGVALTALLVGGYFYQQFQTREAHRLAIANQALAARETAERTRAEGLLSTLQSKQAEHYFENDEANHGVAYLASLVRREPTNEILVSRLLSALTDRSIAVPVWTFNSPASLEGAEFNPNGGQFVTWGWSETNGVANIRNAATGQMRGETMLHTTAIRQARHSPNGSWIATLAANGEARIWDAKNGEPRSAILPGPAQRFGLHHYKSIAFSPDSALLATVGGSEARIWVVSTGQLLIPPLVHVGAILDVEFSPDGRYLAVSGATWTRVFDIRGGTLRHTLAIGDGDLDCLARFSPDGRRIVGIGGFHVRMWDAESGERLLVLDADGIVDSASFSPDGTRLVTSDTVRAVRMFDAASGRLLYAPIMHGLAVREASFDATGERLLTRESRRARIWDSRTGRPLTEWMLHQHDILTAQFSPDGNRVLTATSEHSTLWDVRPGQALNLALRHDRPLVPSARFNPDGSRVVTATGESIYTWFQSGTGTAAVWDAQTGELTAPLIQVSASIQSAEFSPDGQRVVTGAVDGTANLWDAPTSTRVTGQMLHRIDITAVRFSPDGRNVVTACRDGTARVWDAETGRPLSDPLQHSASVSYAEFSPDARLVLTVAAGDQAHLWEAFTGRKLLAYGRNVLTAAFSPDGHRIVTGCGDGTAQVWDLNTGQPIGEPLKHQDRIHSVRFSPDGRSLVTASEDQSARIWDPLSGMPLAEPLLHQGAVLYGEFSPDNRRVATASADNTARVWDVRTGRPLTEPLREGHMVARAEFSPDGTRLLVAAASGLARIWELPPACLRAPAWLPDLAEATVGAKWTDQEFLEPVSPADGLALRAALAQTVGADDLGPWMRWLLADRGDRSVSYASPATYSDYLSRLLEQAHDSVALREALHLSPENPLGMARLAQRLVGSEYSELAKHPHREQQAEFLSERAVKLGPEQGEIWRIRSEILEKAGRFEEAMAAVDRAIASADSKAASWMLKGRWLESAARTEEAVRAYSEAIELASGPPLGPSRYAPKVVVWADEPALFKGALRARSKVLKQLGRGQEAAADLLRSFGPPVMEGESAVFEVHPGDHSALTCQWTFNGVEIPGATNTVFSLTTVAPEQAGIYAARLRDALGRSVSTPGARPPPFLVGSQGLVFGALRQELYFDIQGWNLEDLTNHLSFPDNPDATALVHGFEAVSNGVANYGVRLTGMLSPPKSGEYRFYLSSDDEGMLFLSTDESPRNSRLIAREPIWNDSRGWISDFQRPNRENISGPILLEAGRRYYVEAWMKQGDGLHHLGVTWQLPGEPPPQNGSAPIPGSHLAVPIAWLESGTKW